MFCGGGSAALRPYYVVSPWEGILSKSPNARFQQGAYSHKLLPLLGSQLKNQDGEQGFTFRVFNEPLSDESKQECVEELKLVDSNMFLLDYYPKTAKGDLFYAEIEGYLTPEEDATWEFGLCVWGTARLFVDDKEVVDNATNQTKGEAFFGCGTQEEIGVIALQGGKTYKIRVEFGSAPTSKLPPDSVVGSGKGGVRIGGCPRIDAEEAIQKAVKLAKEVDQVILITGLNVSFLKRTTQFSS